MSVLGRNGGREPSLSLISHSTGSGSFIVSILTSTHHVKHMHKNMQVCGVTHTTDTDMLQSYNSYYCFYRSFFKANFNINCNTTNLHDDLSGCHIGEKSLKLLVLLFTMLKHQFNP